MKDNSPEAIEARYQEVKRQAAKERLEQALYGSSQSDDAGETNVGYANVGRVSRIAR